MEFLVPHSQVAARGSALRTFGPAGVVTLLIWAAVTVLAGPAGLITVAELTGLEITFSVDNAVLNSKLLTKMPRWAQQVFMYFGIFVAVFLIRFAIPNLIVKASTHLGFFVALRLAIEDPQTYSRHLEQAGPAMVAAFGGVFLIMVAVSFFIDEDKDIHWLGSLERRLAPLGRYDNLVIFAMLAMALTLFFTVDVTDRMIVAVAALAGITLHVGLDLLEALTGRNLTGVVVSTSAAIVMLLRLEILDASFSLDGVIGAFAITSSIYIIMAGLGAGAVWVRSITVYLTRTGALAKPAFRYLDHGAHWAIFFLGAVMIAKLYHFELPEWATGSIGLLFIGLAVVSSIVARRRDPEATPEPATPVAVGGH